MKGIKLLASIFATLLLASCMVVAPDGRVVEPAPRPVSDYVGVYEGTWVLGAFRLELFSDGTGLWGGCIIEKDRPKVEVRQIVHWKPVASGIEGEVIESPGADVEKFEGGFFAGQLRIRFVKDKDDIQFSFMSEKDLELSRYLLKEAIIKEKKLRPNKEIHPPN